MIWTASDPLLSRRRALRVCPCLAIQKKFIGLGLVFGVLASFCWHPLTATAEPRERRFPSSYNSDGNESETAVPQRPMDYTELRSSVLNLIAGASQRVWLVSEFLSDSEIVSSIFVAQFRKLDVQVVLGAAKAGDALSRASFLMNQRIPTFMRPRAWSLPSDSALLTDEQLVWINGSFDPYSARREFRISIASDAERQNFEQSFLAAIGQRLTPQVKSLPNVGRAPRNFVAPPSTTSMRDSGSASSGAYNYNRSRHDRRAPQGVATQLPRETISQKKGTKRESVVSDEAPAQEAAGSE
jgi:hypothetical protein